MPKASNAGKAMKYPKQVVAAGPMEACRPGDGSIAGPGSGQGESDSLPDSATEPEADTNMSVAGEEDPGAALDLISGGAATTPTCQAAAERDPGAGLLRPRRRPSR